MCLIPPAQTQLDKVDADDHLNLKWMRQQLFASSPATRTSHTDAHPDLLNWHETYFIWCFITFVRVGAVSEVIWTGWQRNNTLQFVINVLLPLRNIDLTYQPQEIVCSILCYIATCPSIYLLPPLHWSSLIYTASVTIKVVSRGSAEPHSLTPEQSPGRTGRNLEWAWMEGPSGDGWRRRRRAEVCQLKHHLIGNHLQKKCSCPNVRQQCSCIPSIRTCHFRLSTLWDRICSRLTGLKKNPQLRHHCTPNLASIWEAYSALIWRHLWGERPRKRRSEHV